MLLSNGMAGLGFGGADIPGFIGWPSETDFIVSYQLALFFPFFRAHNFMTGESSHREPWR